MSITRTLVLVMLIIAVVVLLPQAGSQAFSVDNQSPPSRSTIDLEGFRRNRAVAKQYLARKQFSLAIPFLEKARSFKDSDFDNGYDLSVAYAQAGQLEKAQVEIHRLVSIRNTPELHSLLGEIESAMHHRKAAAAEYQIAAQMDPSEMHIFDFGESLLLFDGDAAVTIFSYGVNKFPLSGRLRTGLGIAYYFYGDFDKAAETLCDSVDLDPSDPRAIEFLGKLQNESYEVLQKVNKRFSTFLKIHPDSATASYYLGRNLLHSPGREPSPDDSEHAKQLLNIAIRLNPKLSGPYFELGQLFESRGQKIQAIALYEQAIKLDPSQAPYHYRLSFAYRTTGQKAKAQHEVEIFKRLNSAEDARVQKTLNQEAPQ